MDKKYYHNILQRHATPAGTRLIGKNFVFQEYNDPKHASAYCRDYLAKKEKLGGHSKPKRQNLVAAIFPNLLFK